MSGDPDSDIAVALLEPLQALLDFARIKATLSSNDERLLSVLRDPTATLRNGDNLLLTLAGWESASLTALLNHFNHFLGKDEKDLKSLLPSLTQFGLFRRVYDAFALVKTMGVAAAALIRAATNEPDGDTVRDLQAALRARYAAADWREVIRPINDQMRELQRDALVAYILREMRGNDKTKHIDTANKLFEYFLMDVEMEPCMQTSRIRHALSSVQLFIERCLMNLEPRVSPTFIDAQRREQWVWMKRFRVWEANRKVFLFPENWLEPELRDDKSPFFKEIESELLQSDITEDSATTAVLNYLQKLEEVAKLEPCGIYHQEGDGVQTGDVDHVIARTAGAHRKYYYRRREGLREVGSWTPWEQVKLDIEDNPVMPVVWNGRLLLFWLRIMKKGSVTTQGPKPKGDNLGNLTLPPDPPVTVQAMLCWSEYYNGKWQPTKTSDVNNPVSLGSISADEVFDRSLYLLEAKDLREPKSESEGLLVNILTLGGSSSSKSFLLYNTHSLPTLNAADPIRGPARTPSTASDIGGSFSIWYNDLTVDPDFTLQRDILQDLVPFAAIEPHHSHLNVWDAPFFFEDGRHVFYVTTAESRAAIQDSDGFGVSLPPPQRFDDIPHLMLRHDPKLPVAPDRNIQIGDGPGFGLVDPSPMEQFISEDAYIHTGIGASGGVHYGDVEIGPAGVLSNQRRQQS